MTETQLFDSSPATAVPSAETEAESGQKPEAETDAPPEPVLSPDEVGLSGESLLTAMEALLFVACEPLSAKELANLLEVSTAQARAAAEELSLRYEHRGFTLRHIAGGYQFVTPEQYAFLVERLYRPKYQQLSAAALEALAVIAYKQPITRAEVAAVRQVDSDSVINTLLEKKLIHEVGRVNSAGRAILYGTGEEFLSFFGINSLQDLPQLAQEQPLAEDFSL